MSAISNPSYQTLDKIADITGLTAAIVDPFSSGALLAPAFKRRGAKCLAAFSAPTIPDSFRSSYRPEDFASIVPFQSDIAGAARELQKEKVRFVLAGTETGVLLADALSEFLGAPSNGIAMSEARRNKGLMAEAIRRHGLRTPEQFRSGHVADIRAWSHARDRWPIVVKPTAGCGSDGVHLCRSNDETERACRRIIGRRNMLGLVNEAVVAQEFLKGEEYIVDTVSWEGVHRIAAFWKYHRPEPDNLAVPYDSMILMDYEGERQIRLFNYAKRVLDALEIRFGPAHCELIWNEGEPVLVEIGARLSAGNNPILSRMCGGPCALDLTVEACLDPESFFQGKDVIPSLNQTAANVFLIPPRRDPLKSMPSLPRIERLPSFHAMGIGAEMGQPAPKVAGVVTLIHPNPSVIVHDIEAIRSLERDGLYEFEDRS